MNTHLLDTIYQPLGNIVVGLQFIHLVMWIKSRRTIVIKGIITTLIVTGYLCILFIKMVLDRPWPLWLVDLLLVYTYIDILCLYIRLFRDPHLYNFQKRNMTINGEET